MKLTKNDRLGFILFMTPGIIMFLLFFILPVGYVAIVSTLKWNGMTEPVFAGFDNYIALCKNAVFRQSVLNNVIWALVAACVQVPFALLMGLILNEKPRGWKVYRTIYFFPQVISGAALAMLWKAMYNSEYGMINGILKGVGLEHLTQNWLGNLDTAFPSMLMFWVFYIGYYMVIMMSEMSSVDRDFYEAAAIDGASKIQQAWFVSIPMIKSSILTCVTLASVMALRQFEQVYLMTNGGPANSTTVMGLHLYKEVQNARYGVASANAVIMILIGAIVIIGLRRSFRSRKA